MSGSKKILDALLNAPTESAEFRRAAEEVESRPDLQRQLEETTASEVSWLDEMRSALRTSSLTQPHLGKSSMVVTYDPSASGAGSGDGGASRDGSPSFAGDASAVGGADIERVPLDFLDPPHHPELLGRFGRYDIEQVVGTGGMGVVLRAFDSELHRVVAIKVLASHLAHHSSARKRFAREAQAAAAVVHPHVIPIYNVDSEARVPYLVMQFVSGHSLQTHVDTTGPLAVVDALQIAIQTAEGLSAAHARNLVHRDVKPANILLEENLSRVLLSDFGLARAVDDASLTKTGIVAGTPYYMSPEQALGESIGPQSDLFSIGSVLYFMLAGRPPFRASGAMAVLHRICRTPHRPIRDVNPEVPIQLASAVDSLLTKDASKRPQTADEVVAQLSSILDAIRSGRFTTLGYQGSPAHLFDRRVFGDTCRKYTQNWVPWTAGLVLASASVWAVLFGGPFLSDLVGRTNSRTDAAPEKSEAPTPSSDQLAQRARWQSQAEWMTEQTMWRQFDVLLSETTQEISDLESELRTRSKANDSFTDQISGIAHELERLRIPEE